MAGAGPVLRVLSYNMTANRSDPRATVELVRSVRPDVVVVQDGPRRLRWRSRCADLANRFGLVYAGGGEPALGNVIFVGLRVPVLEAWCVQYPLTPGRLMRGAALVRASVAGRPFALAGTRLSAYPDEHLGQVTVLSRVLADLPVPVILAADLGDAVGAPAWRVLADGRVAAGGDDVPGGDGVPRADRGPRSGPRFPTRRSVILVDPGLEVLEHRRIPLPRLRSDSDANAATAILAELRLPG